MDPILEKLRREVAGGVAGLSAEQTQGRRTPEAWSIQQIVEHLVMTYASTAGVFAARIEKGTPTRARASVGQRVGQFMVMRAGYFPAGRIAPDGVRPAAVTLRLMSGPEMEKQVAESLVAMDAVLGEAEGLFGVKARCVSHQVLGPLSVEQWRRFHLAHGAHHLRQIRATREVMGVWGFRGARDSG